MEIPKIGIIGLGNIGSELYTRIMNRKWNVKCVIDIDGIYSDISKKEKIGEVEDYESFVENLDLVFLAIPTFDDGKTAFDYMNFFLEKNIPVVTCEKGALSNYFPELEKYLDKIGYSATVGGGTRLLRYLNEMKNKNLKEIHAIINGTLNYILDEVSKGKNFEETVEEAKKLGYAEPGAKNPLEVINKEAAEDIPMKTSILFNMSKLTSIKIRAKDIKQLAIGEQELKKLIEQAKTRRFIVSITKQDNEEDMIGGFKHKVDDWIISAGFKDINKNPLFSQLIVEGVNNALLIHKGTDGTYKITGPGAGPKPTANSMIIDAEKILRT